MTHKVTITRPDYVLTDEPKPIAMNVFVNERHYAVLRFNGRAYSGCIPTHDGKIVLGVYGLREWRSLASQVNKAAAELDRALRPDKLGVSATSVLTARIAAAKSAQMDFFEHAGVLPGDIDALDIDEKKRLLSRYGEWLEATGIIPSF
jgi:hypothetical protein